MVNALSVDVEDWYHGYDLGIPQRAWPGLERRVDHNTRRLLDLFSQAGARATFFVLGCVAHEHPKLVQEIAAAGHEIGVHGYWHQLVYRQTPAAFRQDTRDAKAAVEHALGFPVLGYRAPSWSITRHSLWALPILEEEGFMYDSSIFPVKIPVFGMTGVPHRPFRPRLDGRQLRLWEFPPPPLPLFRLALPFSGGLFLRLCPRRLLAWGLRRINAQGRPALVYVHPWEVDLAQPRGNVAGWRRMVRRLGMSATEDKLACLLKEFRFSPICEVLKEYQDAMSPLLPERGYDFAPGR